MISAKKRFIGIFISIILVIALAIPVFASAGMEASKENDEKIILFLNEESGKDTNDGISEEKAVKSLKRIKELFKEKVKEIEENADVKAEDVLKTIVVCSDEQNEEIKEKLKDEDIDITSLEEYEKSKEEQEISPTPDEQEDDKNQTSPTPSMDPVVTENPTVTPTNNPTSAPTENPTVIPSTNPTVSPTVNPTVNPDKNTAIDSTDKEADKDAVSDKDKVTESEISPQDVENDEAIEVQSISDANTEETVSDTATAQINEAANQPAVMNEISAEAINEQAIQAEAANTSALRSIPGRDIVGRGTTKQRTQTASAVTSNTQTSYNNSVTPTATTLVKGGNVQTGNEDNVLVYTVCACLSICALVCIALLTVESKRKANNLKIKEEIEKFSDSIK